MKVMWSSKRRANVIDQCKVCKQHMVVVDAKKRCKRCAKPV